MTYRTCRSTRDASQRQLLTDAKATKKFTVMALATISCALWGSAPSCIKMGYQLFQIDASDTMTILLFAGLRFTLAGLLVVLGFSLMNRKVVLPERASWKAILPLALTQTAVQYLLYYIGAAHASGIKVSILSGSNAFFSVLIACLIFRQETLTLNKVLGCLAGIAGIILVNLRGSTEAFSLNMSFLGEGFVLLSSISSAVSSVLIRRFSQKNNPVMLSGYQFMTGGILLIVVALAGGGHLTNVTLGGLALLLYLAFVSAVAYTLWSLLLQYNPVSKVAVYNSLIPVFGVFLSAIILGEGGSFSVNTIAALVLVCAGIWLVNFVKQKS